MLIIEKKRVSIPAYYPPQTIHCIRYAKSCPISQVAIPAGCRLFVYQTQDESLKRIKMVSSFCFRGRRRPSIFALLLLLLLLLLQILFFFSLPFGPLPTRKSSKIAELVEDAPPSLEELEKILKERLKGDVLEFIQTRIRRLWPLWIGAFQRQAKQNPFMKTRSKQDIVLWVKKVVFFVVVVFFFFVVQF